MGPKVLEVKEISGNPGKKFTKKFLLPRWSKVIISIFAKSHSLSPKEALEI